MPHPPIPQPASRQAQSDRLPRRLAAIVCAALLPAAAHAADVVVRIGGLAEPLGQVGCALFSSDQGFPLDSAGARVQWLAAEAQGVACRFADVPAGRYAVSIAHDLNGNRRVDRNVLGMPTEPWGVSNDARPTLRAPRFDEAAFTVGADAQEFALTVRVAK